MTDLGNRITHLVLFMCFFILGCSNQSARDSAELPDHAVRQYGTYKFRNFEESLGVSISGDGKIIVSIGWDSIRIWDAETGDRLHTFEQDIILFHSIEWSADDSALYIADPAEIVSIDLKAWHIKSDSFDSVYTLFKDNGNVTALIRSKTGKPAYFTAETGQISKAPDMFKLEETGTVPGREFLLAQTGKNPIELWNVKTGVKLGLLNGMSTLPDRINVSPDNTRFAAIHAGESLAIWDINSRSMVKELKDIYPGTRLSAWSPDSSLFAKSDNGYIAVWDTKTWTPNEIPVNWDSAVLVFSKDGKRLVADAQAVIQLDTTSWKRIHSPKGHEAYINRLIYCDNGASFISVSSGWTLFKWDTVSGQGRGILENHHIYGVSPEGRFAAVSQKRKPMELCDLKSGEKRFTVNPGTMIWMGVGCEFSPDSKYLAFGKYKEKVYIVSTADNKLVQTCSWPRGDSVLDLTFSPDGKSLLGVDNKDAYLWDPATGKVKKEFNAQSRLDTPAFSHDGRRIAVGCSQGIQIWGIDGRLITTLRTREKEVLRDDFSEGSNAVVFTLDDKVLISGGYYPQNGLYPLIFWDVEKGQELFRWYGHRASILTLILSPDGKRVLSGGWDTAILEWDISDIQSLIHEARKNRIDFDKYSSPEDELLIRAAVIREVIHTDLQDDLEDMQIAYIGLPDEETADEKLLNAVKPVPVSLGIYRETFKVNQDEFGYTDSETNKTGVLVGVGRIYWINKRKACIEGYHTYGPLSGTGNGFILEKINGRWVIVGVYGGWIS